jgi:hypothetical protein
MKWIYRENYGVVVDEEQELILKDYFSNDKPEENKRLQVIHVHEAIKMVEKAVNCVKGENEKIDYVKKRNRRTKEQIKADENKSSEI